MGAVVKTGTGDALTKGLLAHSCSLILECLLNVSA